MNCQHLGCTCTVAEGDDFCSDVCRARADDPMDTDRACGCDHPECAGAGGDLSGTG